MEIRLSGVVERLLWEMSDYNAFLFFNDPVAAVEIAEDVPVIDAGKLTQQLISN